MKKDRKGVYSFRRSFSLYSTQNICYIKNRHITRAKAQNDVSNFFILFYKLTLKKVNYLLASSIATATATVKWNDGVSWFYQM